MPTRRLLGTDFASCEGKSGKIKNLTPETNAHFGKILYHSRNELDSVNGSGKCEHDMGIFLFCSSILIHLCEKQQIEAARRQRLFRVSELLNLERHRE